MLPLVVITLKQVNYDQDIGSIVVGAFGCIVR